MSLPFDEYSLKARIWPAFIVCSPIFISYPVVITHFFEPSHVTVASIMGLAILALMSEVIRYFGVKEEKNLLKQWGGMPSTKVMRWADKQCSREYKQKMHALVKEKFGILLSSEHEEKSDSDVADKKITEAFLILRNRLRDSKKGSVLQDNINYGFSRNLFGARWIWFGFAFIGVISISLTKGTNILQLILAVLYVMVIVLIEWGIMKKHVEHCAMRYVESAWNQLLTL